MWLTSSPQKNIDEQVQLYLRKIHEFLLLWSLMLHDHTQLAEFSGHIELSRQWAYHLLGQMKFVRRKATTAKSKHTPKDFAAMKRAFLDDVIAVVPMDDVPPELVLNWDQTGIHVVSNE